MDVRGFVYNGGKEILLLVKQVKVNAYNNFYKTTTNTHIRFKAKYEGWE